jgi:DnaJ family protein C protein 13
VFLFAGAALYLLDLFCNSNIPVVREKTAELLARMGADKLVGPKVRLTVNRFLPTLFTDAMRETPHTCVHMFEGIHENPELIWDVDARQRACSVISSLREEYVTCNLCVVLFYSFSDHEDICLLDVCHSCCCWKCSCIKAC